MEDRVGSTRQKGSSFTMTFRVGRPVLVSLPDGTNRIAEVSLSGRGKDGRVLTLRLVEDKRRKVKEEIVRMYL